LTLDVRSPCSYFIKIQRRTGRENSWAKGTAPAALLISPDTLQPKSVSRHLRFPHRAVRSKEMKMKTNKNPVQWGWGGEGRLGGGVLLKNVDVVWWEYIGQQTATI